MNCCHACLFRAIATVVSCLVGRPPCRRPPSGSSRAEHLLLFIPEACPFDITRA